MAEFGSCHRYEPSGALHGIMRVRGFTQDDAHIFCTEDQITAETIAFCELLLSIYRDLGFADVPGEVLRPAADARRQRRGLGPGRGGAARGLEAAGVAYTLNPGEGAFYGPKLEFVLRDAIGRDWQCGTLQVDFVLPERLDANYVGRGRPRTGRSCSTAPSSARFERFIGVLIEHYAGELPAVAGAGPGGGRDHRLRCRRLCPGGRGGAAARPGCAVGARSAQREDQLQGPWAHLAKGAPCWPWSAAARRRSAPGAAPAGPRREQVRCRWRRRSRYCS